MRKVLFSLFFWNLLGNQDERTLWFCSNQKQMGILSWESFRLAWVVVVCPRVHHAAQLSLASPVLSVCVQKGLSQAVRFGASLRSPAKARGCPGFGENRAELWQPSTFLLLLAACFAGCSLPAYPVLQHEPRDVISAISCKTKQLALSASVRRCGKSAGGLSWSYHQSSLVKIQPTKFA